jgi:flagellar protein FliS
MTFASARSTYRQTGNSGVSVPDDPHQIIRVILSELEKSLNVMKAAHASGAEYPPEHVNKALRAIYLLQSSLDFDKGEDIAVSLFELYEFCRQNILAAFRKDPDAELTASADAISGILDAWTEIGPQVRQFG